MQQCNQQSALSEKTDVLPDSELAHSRVSSATINTRARTRLAPFRRFEGLRSQMRQGEQAGARGARCDEISVTSAARPNKDEALSEDSCEETIT